MSKRMFIKCFFALAVLLSLLSAHSTQKKPNSDASGHAGNEENASGHASGEANAHESNDPDSAHVMKQLDGVGIDENVGKYISKDTVFTNQEGKVVKLGDYLGDKPLLLSFLYYTCPSVCQYVANAEAETMKMLQLKLGEDYRAVGISFDKRDGAKEANETYSRYAEMLRGSSALSENDQSEVDWSFLYGNEDAINTITSELGFQYKWLKDVQEFAHTAAIYIITPEGKISRYFYGLYFSPFDLRLALLEAKKEEHRGTIDRILLYCYRYDSEARGYVADAWRLMRVGAGLTAAGIGIFLFMMIKYERRRDDLWQAKIASEKKEGEKKESVTDKDSNA